MPTGIGLLDLPKSYATDPPINPSTLPSLTSPDCKGILWRITWDKLCPSHGSYNWTWLDACFAAANVHNKLSALEVLSGNFSPAWFFELPNAKSIMTVRTGLKTTVPFDPTFWAEWGKTQNALANRYKNQPKLRYVKMTGAGHSSESFFATDPSEFDAADALAKQLGYAGCDDGWRQGVKKIIDIYNGAWAPKMIVQGTGVPYANGDAALQYVCDYGRNTYPGQFGVRSDDLYNNQPHTGDLSATLIQQSSPTCSATGFQMGNAMGTSAKLDAALNIGTGFGAHFIELFDSDMNDPTLHAVRASANARMGVA